MKKGSIQSTMLTYLLLSGIAALVSSCQDYEPYNDQHLQDVAYTHEFERQFGEIDPNQNWDLFGQLARKKEAPTRADQYVSQVTITDLTTPIKITKDENAQYEKVLPENAGGPGAAYANTNLGRVIQDFVATSHTFTIAPVHWTTSGTDEIGIYWYTDDEKYADVTIMGNDGEMYWLVRKKILDCKTHLYYVNGNVERQVTGQNVKNVFTNDNIYLNAYPIQVEIPEEIPFYGFYITQRSPSSGTRYSESKLNTPITGWASDQRPCYIATFNIQRDIDASSKDTRDYLCFEDWFVGGDFDLNDVVFTIDGFDNQSIVDRTTTNEHAILVCEDLKQYDFDFNDIALELKYTEEIDREYFWDEHNGRYELDEENTKTIEELKVTALAAGGAFESTVSFNNEEDNWSYNWGEIHSLLNESPVPSNSRNHKIINAAPTYTDLHGQSITFPTEDHPLPDKKVGAGNGQYPTYLSQLFASGFFVIHSEEENRDAVNINSNGSYSEGSAPQMMLLPEYFEWPQEQKYIKEAYTKFTDWVQDVTKTDWILSSQEAELITDRGNLTPTNQDTPSEITQSFQLTHENGTFTFTGSNNQTVTYRKGQFLEFPAELIALVNDNASAKLHITYSIKRNVTYYLDDAAGQEILKDNTGSSGNNYTVTYTISPTRLNQAVKAVSSNGKVGIWIVARNETNNVNDIEVEISKAEIDIHNETTEAHHKLFVNPLFMTFETDTEQQIKSQSSTGGVISFTSSDESIVKVEQIDATTAKVWPIADGYASIVVRAEAPTVNGKTYKRTSERVSVEVIMGSNNTVILNLGATQEIAGGSGDNDLTHFALCTTVRDVMDDWNNGATLTVTKTAGDVAYFRIQNANGTNISQKQQTTNSTTFTLSANQLRQCRNTDGTYSFKILHSGNTYIQSAVLNKRN